jgi:hypothetical protein
MFTRSFARHLSTQASFMKLLNKLASRPCLAALLVSLLAFSGASNAGVSASTPFPASDASYGCYRIPAAVTLPNGNVLAFAEGRPSGCPDFGNIEIVMRISTNQGAAWGSQAVAASSGTLTADNPSPVVDTLDPNYWLSANNLLITSGNFAYSDLTQLDANDVGIIYENGSNGIRFMKLPISMIITSP